MVARIGINVQLKWFGMYFLTQNKYLQFAVNLSGADTERTEPAAGDAGTRCGADVSRQTRPGPARRRRLSSHRERRNKTGPERRLRGGMRKCELCHVQHASMENK